MGVSNKNAQDNIQPKGNKKPLQVLHISKKDSQKKRSLKERSLKTNLDQVFPCFH